MACSKLDVGCNDWEQEKKKQKKQKKEQQEESILSSAFERHRHHQYPRGPQQLADNLQTNNASLCTPIPGPECDATHRSFRVNVLHVIYTRHQHHHQHHHPRHHNHHHRWITLHSGSDSIDSSWRSRWKSHGVNNKCFSNYTTRLTLFSICSSV